MRTANGLVGALQIAVAAFAITLVGRAPAAALQADIGRQADIGEVLKLKRVDPLTRSRTTADSTDQISIFRTTDLSVLLHPGSDRRLLGRDSIRLGNHWKTWIDLALDPRRRRSRGRLTLTPDLTGESGRTTALGVPSRDGTGLYALDRGPDGRTEVRIHQGAVVVRKWKGDLGQLMCFQAARAKACNTSTSYAIQQDSASGLASIFVQSGEVVVSREQGPASFTQVVGPDEAFQWSAETVAHALILSPEAVSNLHDAIEYNGDDIWHNFREELLLIPVAAVVVCLVTDIWFCGGDGDATGNVIVSPAMGPRR